MTAKVSIRLVVADVGTQRGSQGAVEPLDKPVRLRVVCGSPGLFYHTVFETTQTQNSYLGQCVFKSALNLHMNL